MNVGIYHNLPSGGAGNTYQSTKNYLKKYYKVQDIKEPKYDISNILKYLYTALYISPINQHKLANSINSDLLICYQSWIIKSPSILRYFKKKIIYICHDTLREYYDTDDISNQSLYEKLINIVRYPIKILDRFNIINTTALIISNSEYSRERILKAYGVNSKVIYPGINVNKYQNNIPTFSNNQVITIGSVNKLKRQLIFINILSKIDKKIRPNLVIIGNGYNLEYLNQLKRTAKILGVKVRILVNATDQRKIDELQKSKLFLYAPISEPFGLSIIEAISAGIPIVAYNKGGGYREVINKSNGRIMYNLSVNDWSAEISELINDKKWLTARSKYNMGYAKKHFDENIMNNKILNIIKSI